MITFLHVFAIGFQHPGIGSGLRKDFAEHPQVQTQGLPQAQPLGKACGVDVHHHVDQRLDLCGRASSPDVTPGSRQLGQDGLSPFARALFPSGHQVQGPLASLGDTGRHAGLNTLSAHRLSSGFHHHVGGGTDGCTVDEQFPRGAFEQAVPFLSKQRLHRGIVRNHRKDHIGQGGHCRQS